MNTSFLAELWLPTIPWGIRLEVHGLDPERTSLALTNWPARNPSAATDAYLHVEVVDQPVGFAPREGFIGGVATWRDSKDFEVQVSGGHVAFSVEDGRLFGRGTVSEASPLRGIDALLRATVVAGLARRGVMVLHASAVRRGDEGVVFLGESGAGKTTTARRLGRERGFTRICDDVIAVDVEAWPPVLHPLPFERHDRSSLSSTAVAMRAGARIHKAAALSELSRTANSVPHWRDAVITLGPPPGAEEQQLRLFERLCCIPMAEFAVAPSGSLGPTIEAWLDGVPAPGHPLDRPEHLVQAPATMNPSDLGQDRRAIRRARNVAWRVLDGAAVLVAPSSPTIQVLNPVGTRIWELADGRSVSQILDELVNEFEVERTQAQQDLERFMKDMGDRGLLEVIAAEVNP